MHRWQVGPTQKKVKECEREMQLHYLLVRIFYINMVGSSEVNKLKNKKVFLKNVSCKMNIQICFFKKTLFFFFNIWTSNFNMLL